MLGIQRASGMVAVQFFKRPPYKKSHLPSGFRVSSNVTATAPAPTVVSAANSSNSSSTRPQETTSNPKNLSSSNDTDSNEANVNRPKSKRLAPL